MSCNLCTTKFNFFHKEVGCPNCGLSFCSKCLKQKCRLPGKGGAEHSVCKSCYSKLTGASTSQNIVVPPDIFLKRLECLENPAAPPITMYKNDHKMHDLRSGLSVVDQQLLDRLEKLKDKAKGPPPSVSELQIRLASLKGENTYVEGPGKQTATLLHSHSMETDQQKADSLLEQFVSEREIEFAHNPQQEIEARLASLREKGVRPNEGPYIANLHDSSGSEEDVDRITKKIMDEVKLDMRNPLHEEDKPEDKEGDEEELPWCVLCNEDAAVRCLDCGGDLYCSKCVWDVHKSWPDKDHRFEEFKRK